MGKTLETFLDLPVSPDRSYNFTSVSLLLHLSVHFFYLFICPLVKSFCQNCLSSFLRFFFFTILKSDRARFFRKIHFYPNLGKKGPKIGYFAFFWKCCHLGFLKTMQNESSFNFCLSFHKPPCLPKFLF